MSNMHKMFALLKEKYPTAGCELNHNSPFELLVAVILSAQCTDKRVNEVTKTLFARANTPQQFANIDIAELERLIFTCGFYRNKAKNIKAASKVICEKFGGKVPSTMDELRSLDGVGRKTANVVLSVAFGQPTIAVDTHVFRVSHRLGFSNAATPDEVEKDLMQVIPDDLKPTAHHLLIFHGRYCCKAIKPNCEDCPISSYCVEKDKIKQNR
ncbi:MAG: endonuclease III [Clostridiales bacterium]|nr:endonuclease III [Clostridiales bacterium]